MTVIRRPDSPVWHYKFVYQGTRYRGTTGQMSKRDAEAFEADVKRRVRRLAAGIETERPGEGPRFQDWAEIYYLDAAAKVKAPDRIKDLTRVGLRFWGARPAGEAPDPTRPYHDLRLTDVVADPSWLLRWEEWLASTKLDAPRTGKRFAKVPLRKRVWSAQTKNQYRSWLSRMFHLAMSPAYRLQTGILSNPMVGTWRDRARGRQVVINVDDLLAIMNAASYHLRLAIAIGMLAPKLREGNILSLRYDTHIDPDYRYIRLDDHKTDQHGDGAPMVAPISKQLAAIFQADRKRRPLAKYVIAYQGKPVKGLEVAMRGAVERAAVTRPHLQYGRFTRQGITFHTVRHSAATLLAELNVSPEKRQKAMGHLRFETTMAYTHLHPIGEIETAETLSQALPLIDVVTAPRTRAGSVTNSVATSTQNDGERPAETNSDGERRLLLAKG